eukprot:TRINITY_DN12315_c0_g3_i1.p1 TRINITY_DN12315_c0_g3~~TRINITY_DN12315_c0_g3_i1.p1  ORF type:complete len:684 (+),score=144.61 TRINITY_DN12315_c0_g3_i1:55-2106(+)
MAGQSNTVILGILCILLLAMYPMVYHMGYRHAEERHHDLMLERAERREFIEEPAAGYDTPGQKASRIAPKLGSEMTESLNFNMASERQPKDLAKERTIQPPPPATALRPAQKITEQKQAVKPVEADPSSLHLQYDVSTPWPQIPMPNPKTMPSGEPFEPMEDDVTEDQVSYVDGLHGIPVTNISGIPSECKWIDINTLPAERLPTTVKCLGAPHNRSCIYTNVYYGDRGHFSIEMPDKPLPERDEYTTNRDGKYGHPWTPVVKKAADEAEARTLVVQTHNARDKPRQLIVCPHTNLYYHTQFASNPGHGLWDGLYPGFMSAIRMGYGRTPFRVMPSLPEWRGPCQPGKTMGCQAKEIMDNFGGHGMIMLQTLEPFRKEGITVHFEKMIVGSGRMAQRFLTADVSLNGGRSLNGMRYYRDRMYWSHNMTYRTWQPKRDMKQIKAFIVDNKRYTSNDRKALDSAIETLATEGMHIEKISLRDYWPFKKLLEKLGSSDIYITGPGTGMMLSPFMPDMSVVVNLGDCFKRHDRIHPSSEEEYVTEATPYMRGLYYDSHTRLQGLQVEGLLKVFREAFKLTRDGFALPVPKRLNLSPEGRVFAEACDMAPQACQQMLDEMNGVTGPWQCVVDAWASFVVYEVGGYKEGGKELPNGKNGTCTMPRTEIRALRQKYAMELGTNEENQRQC